MTYKISWLLFHSARKGNIGLAGRLINSYGLSHRPEWYDGYAFLMVALKNKKPDFVRFLISSGCPVTKTGTTEDGPLHIALANGDIKIIGLLLNKKADVNAKNKFGKTPLALAVESGNVRVINILLNNDAVVNTRARTHLTPLHMACRRNFTEIVRLLLAKGGDVSAETIYNKTPLHFAAQFGSWKVVKLLLDHGADVNARTIYDETPLHFAVQFAVRVIVNLLIERGAHIDDQDEMGRTALFLAVARGDLPIIEDILKLNPNTEYSSNQTCMCALRSDVQDFEDIVVALLDYYKTVSPQSALEVLYEATEKGDHNIVSCLLTYGVNSNAVRQSGSNGLSPLHIAVKNKHEKVAQLLISHKANVNARDKQDRPPIFYSVDNVDLKITKLLLANGVEDKDLPKVFHMAVEKNSMEIAEALLLHGVKVNVDEYGNIAPDSPEIEDKNMSRREKHDLFMERWSRRFKDPTPNAGTTALHVALEKGFDSMVEFLLTHNANVNALSKRWGTPLHISAEKGHIDMCNLLLSRGARIHAKDHSENRPLHRAVREGHEEIVKLLLKNGAQVNGKGYDGKSPLHYAAENGNSVIFDTLLTLGANVNCTCDEGKTPLHYAAEKGNDKIVATLLENGADVFVKCREFEMSAWSYAFRNSQYHYKHPDEDEPLDEQAYENTMELIHNHQTKMEAAGLGDEEESLSCFGPSELELKCKKEVAKMKKVFLKGTNVSYYDVLSKDAEVLSRYLSKDSLLLASGQMDAICAKFPLYASIIKFRLRQALAKM